jgi:2-keto-4-pentenoate hydratase/2-oxohepta-3-ene-1,7-dioic acid hydratase in catechol pathway
MKVVSIRSEGGERLGIQTGSGVVDVAAAVGGAAVPLTVGELIVAGEAGRSALESLASGVTDLLDEDALTLGPCVPNPGKIICIGLNYRRHAEESNLPIPTTPVVFSKFSNTLAGHKEEVPLPIGLAEQFDYEAELCAVIGRRAKGVSEAEALDYVFGYCNANDLSVRDLQTRTSQWLLGKTSDKFFPIGPYLVTADEVGDPQALQVVGRVNGQVVQNSNTADMIFSVAEIVSYCSRYFTLEPGDLITTGTPEGVAMGRPDKPWLKPGDVVEIEIDKLGVLQNTMIG